MINKQYIIFIMIPPNSRNVAIGGVSKGGVSININSGNSIKKN